MSHTLISTTKEKILEQRKKQRTVPVLPQVYQVPVLPQVYQVPVLPQVYQVQESREVQPNLLEVPQIKPTYHFVPFDILSDKEKTDPQNSRRYENITSANVVEIKPTPYSTSIQIGKYLFECCYCFEHSQTHLQTAAIFLKSTLFDNQEDQKNERRFIVIQSLSQIGLWRLYYPLPKDDQTHDDHIYKGMYDYIQQTMISIHLQIHLDNYFSRAEKSSRGIYEKKYYKYLVYSQGIRNHIDDTYRALIYQPIFDNTNYNSTRCGSLYNPLLLNKLFSNMEENYKNNSTIVINKIEKTINLDPLYHATLNGYIFSSTLIHNTDPSFNCILYFIRYSLDIKYIYNDKVVLTDSQRIEIEQISEFKGVKNYYAPIILIKSDTISKYGTYENYILSGSYICKILDYCKQSQHNAVKCSYNYKFIGDLYQNIFPYKNFIRGEIDKLIQEYETFKEHPQMNDVEPDLEPYVEPYAEPYEEPDLEPDAKLIKYLKYKMKYLKLQNKLK
jgi:hypothetical protein